MSDSGLVSKVTAPESEAALLTRAKRLAGSTLAEIASELNRPLPRSPERAKGFIGSLLETALGASAGNRSAPDFEALGIELKTIPLSAAGQPKESTFVCSIALSEMADLDWEHSRVAHKLARVLWVPVESDKALAFDKRRIGAPILWSPSPKEQAILRDDWEMFAEWIAQGRVDEITGHLGQALQIRPKAAHGRVRRLGPNDEGSASWTLPRGFYLRSSFTRAIIAQALVPLVPAHVPQMPQP